MSNDKVVAKPSRPFSTRQVPAAPKAAPAAPRKLFSIPRTINIGTRKFLVIGGLSPHTVDGHRPFISAVYIAKKLGLDLRECLLADPRELGKIEAGKQAGLAVKTVEDVL